MKPHLFKILVKESNINFHNWYSTAEGFHHPVFKKIAGCVIPNWVMFIEQDNGQWGTVEAEWQKAGESFAKRLETGKIDIFDIEKKHYVVGNKIWHLTDMVYKDKFKNLPTTRLLATLKQIWKHYGYLNGVGYVAVISDLGHGYLLGQLSKILLQKQVPVQKIQTFQSLLSSPNKKTLFWQEQMELISLCCKYGNIEQLSASKDLSRHVNKWFWLNYGYQGPIWTKADFLKRAEEIYKNKNIQKALDAHKKYFTELLKKQKALKRQLRITPREDYFFETARLFTFLKGYRIEMRHRYSYALDQIFLELGKRQHLPLKFFQYATREEIIATATGKKVKNEEILKRKQKMLYLLNNLKGQFIKFEKIDKTFQELLAEEKIEFTGKLSGQTAYPGKVKGMVRILNKPEDVQKLKEGNILVTFATTPDFLPAMMKAAAYVTDQGGITSHAAITAREMKKPCVIGTKHASQVFKDGDLVEVDANKGIIKKIS